MIILGVDPGLSGTGVAVYDVEDHEFVSVGVYYTNNANKNDDWNSRAVCLAYDAFWEATIWNAKVVYCEWPEFFKDEKGYAATSKGDIYKLSFLVGALAAYCHKTKSTEFRPVKVHDWKGQLPKNVVEQRIRKRIGEDEVRKLKPNSHAWDAMGIALYGTYGEI